MIIGRGRFKMRELKASVKSPPKGTDSMAFQKSSGFGTP